MRARGLSKRQLFLENRADVFSIGILQWGTIGMDWMKGHVQEQKILGKLQEYLVTFGHFSSDDLYRFRMFLQGGKERFLQEFSYYRSAIGIHLIMGFLLQLQEQSHLHLCKSSIGMFGTGKRQSFEQRFSPCAIKSFGIKSIGILGLFRQSFVQSFARFQMNYFASFLQETFSLIKTLSGNHLYRAQWKKESNDFNRASF